MDWMPVIVALIGAIPERFKEQVREILRDEYDVEV
jgi:hypothetical protein